MGETDASGSWNRCARSFEVAVLALILGTFAGTTVQAQQISGYVEWIGTDLDATTDPSSGTTTDTERTSFFQRYSVDATWNLFPNLQFSVGGLFERNHSEDTGNDGQPDVTLEKLRPYLNLVLGTRFYSADLGYYRLENRQEAGELSTRDIQENYSATLGWRPEDFPVWSVRLLRTDRYDAEKELRDTTESLVDVTLDYSPIDTVQLYYRVGIQEQEDRLEGFKARVTSHAGRANYADAWWDRRVQFSGEYNINYQKRKILEAGSGVVVTPVLASSGLSAITEFPVDVILDPNPALIDGNQDASAGINLGLPPPGGDDRPRNMGLEFPVPAPVDNILLSVDRELPRNIYSFFRWEIYSSTDNQTWVREGSATLEKFDVLETRFDLRFEAVAAPYIKVVTSPLDRTVPDADEYPFILVTEMAAFRRTSADDLPDQPPGETTHRVTANLRTRILRNRNFYHDLSYSQVRPQDLPSSYTVSNALSYSEQLNRVFTVAARASREDGRDDDRDFVSYPYSASLRATWLPTLRQNLVFSGTRTENDNETNDFKSLYLQTSAELYRGVTASLGLGTSTRSQENGQESDTNQLTAAATLIPNPIVSVNLIYQLQDSEQRGGDLDDERKTDYSAGEVSLGLRPFPSLYLFGSYRVEELTDRPDRTLKNYNVSWSPFPQGSLQISLRYDETYRSEQDALTIVASANVRWNITRSRYLELTYLRSEFDTEFDNREQDSIQARLRFTF